MPSRRQQKGEVVGSGLCTRKCKSRWTSAGRRAVTIFLFCFLTVLMQCNNNSGEYYYRSACSTILYKVIVYQYFGKITRQ
ncbi:hypothetical protein LI328DRAFT_86604 [Trichoderma asperelloides]|nr:hypothetical protein LI328DRAFT_86604 [Trichoderma asperelloides]